MVLHRGGSARSWMEEGISVSPFSDRCARRMATAYSKQNRERCPFGESRIQSQIVATPKRGGRLPAVRRGYRMGA